VLDELNDTVANTQPDPAREVALSSRLPFLTCLVQSAAQLAYMFIATPAMFLSSLTYLHECSLDFRYRCENRALPAFD
jgi:hypothetical protein